MLFKSVPTVVVVAELTPHLNRHIVIGLCILKRRVNTDDRGAEGGDVFAVICLPPRALYDVAALCSRGALKQGAPCSQAAVAGVIQVALLELLQPSVVLTELRAQCVTYRTTQQVVFFGLDGQAHQRHVLLVLQNTRGKVVLVPRCHDDDHLRLGLKTGLQGVLPLVPNLVAVVLAVRFFAVLNGVVNNQQVGRVARDARFDTGTEHPAPAVAQLKLVCCPNGPRLQTKKGSAELLDLLHVLSSELLRRVVVVARLNDSVLWVSPQIPTGKALRHGQRLTMLRRRFY